MLLKVSCAAEVRPNGIIELKGNAKTPPAEKLTDDERKISPQGTDATLNLDTRSLYNPIGICKRLKFLLTAYFNLKNLYHAAAKHLVCFSINTLL